MSFPDICFEQTSACPNEMPTIQVSQSVPADISLQLRDVDGDAFVTNTSTDTVQLRALEYWGQTNPYLDIAGTVDNNTGLVSFDVTAAQLYAPGTFLAQAAVARDDGIVLKFMFYLEVREDLNHNDSTYSTLSIAEIRLSIKDRCPSDNFLLDDVQFSNTEIMWAIRRPVEYWNEIPPSIETYTPSTFPYRYSWLDGVIGELYNIAATHQERNRLSYQASGVSVDDSDKYTSYRAMSNEFKARFQLFVRRKKKEINMGKLYGRTAIASMGSSSTTRTYY